MAQIDSRFVLFFLNGTFLFGDIWSIILSSFSIKPGAVFPEPGGGESCEATLSSV